MRLLFLPFTLVFILLLNWPVRAIETAQVFTFKPPVAGGSEMVYYLIDWGDGTMTPTARGFATASPSVAKIWKKPGNYQINARAVTLSGKVIPLKKQSIAVTGKVLSDVFLPAREFGGAPVATPYVPQFMALHFEQVQSLDALWIERHPGFPFPDNFCIEFSTDGGVVWNDIPAASFMNFPDTRKSYVVIPLHGLCANAVRVISYRPPEVEKGHYALRLGSLRASARTQALFEMDADPTTAADWNNMWLVYGTAANEVHHSFTPWRPTDRPDEGGLLGIGSTIWAHWNSMKLSWLDDPSSKIFYEGIVNSYPQDDLGLVGVSPGSFLHLGHSKHYVTPAIFTAGLSHWHLMHRNAAFLQNTFPKTKGTLLERMRKAMRYQLETMGGQRGVLTIRDPQHDGTVKGQSGNYWDGWRFGYQSAYENTLYYESLRWMSRLESSLGNHQQASAYAALRDVVKKRYNELFWDDTKGRYIGAIDAEGNRHDYGFTFVNLEAIASGIALPKRAEKVLQWLDGERIVDSDTSKGADIYHFRIAPRANTLAAEAVKPSWWDNWTMEVGPGTMGEYGKQIQNGGHIFYVSYYDLMARLRTRGADAAFRRMRVILDEFHKDQLRRKPGNRLGSTHLEGILREFPESGLVPLFFVTGILGLEPDADGLRISSSLPSGWRFAGVTEYHFAGQGYRIRAERDLPKPVVNGNQITVPSKGKWILKPDGTLKNEI